MAIINNRFLILKEVIQKRMQRIINIQLNGINNPCNSFDNKKNMLPKYSIYT